MSDKERFTLEELNELSTGMGDKIFVLFENHNGYYDLLRIEKEIKSMLSSQSLDVDDVMITRGIAEGLSVESAIENAARHYQFLDQFDA